MMHDEYFKGEERYIFLGNDLQIWHSSGRLRCDESDGREYS